MNAKEYARVQANKFHLFLWNHPFRNVISPFLSPRFRLMNGEFLLNELFLVLIVANPGELDNGVARCCSDAEWAHFRARPDARSDLSVDAKAEGVSLQHRKVSERHRCSSGRLSAREQSSVALSCNDVETIKFVTCPHPHPAGAINNPV